MPLEFTCPVCQTRLTDLARAWPKINRNGPIPDFRPDLGPCWVWTGALNGGYGAMQVDGHQRRVHRVVWETIKGPIPDGLTLDHLCRVRHCVNPDHLEPVTSGENWRRGYHAHAVAMRNGTCTRGHPLTPETTRRTSNGYYRCVVCLRDAARRRYAANPRERVGFKHGEQHPGAKLTEEKVREMRRLYADGGISARSLGQMFGVQPNAVVQIVKRQRWRHVV